MGISIPFKGTLIVNWFETSSVPDDKKDYSNFVLCLGLLFKPCAYCVPQYCPSIQANLHRKQRPYDFDAIGNNSLL